MTAQGARASVWRDLLVTCRPLYPAIAAGLPIVIVNRLAGMVLPASTKFLVDDILTKHKLYLLYWFFVATIGASLVQAISTYALGWFVERAQEQFMADMRAKVQAHVMSLPLVFHDSHKTGALVSAVVNDVQGFARVFSSGLTEIGGALTGAVVAYVILVWINPLLATAGLAVILLYTFLSQGALRRAEKLHMAHAQVKADVMGRLSESLSGVRVVKAYAAEQQENTTFAAGADRLRVTYLKAMLTTQRLRSISVATAGIGTALIIGTGALKVASGSLTIGGLMTFSSILFLLIAPISQLASLAPEVSEALSGARRTLALLANPPEGASERRTQKMPQIGGRVELKNVTFSYRAGQPILNDVSFTAEPGTVTALIGRSGAGKSTVAALIASLYSPTSGTVIVDEYDLASVTFESYRRQLGIVLQETFLFDGSIIENVAFSRPGVSRAKVIQACKLARVDEFAEQMPDNYDALVGERGVRLSGGQRQRIAIARALIADPRILILDEPTFGMDAYSEEIVYEALMSLMRGRTTFVIAHDIARVRHADQILVMEDGRIVEVGGHDELMRRGRFYKALLMKSTSVARAGFYALDRSSHEASA